MLAGGVLLLAAPLRAQQAPLDADLKTPYHVSVVLGVVEHRVFTPVFQEQLQRDVQSRLQAALGAMGTVQVTRQHALSRKIAAEGLDALDGWDEVSDRRTCFLQIAYEGGEYRLATRFLDGPSGLAGPLVQRARTSERGLVLSMALDLLERDFSASATVEGHGKDMFLALRGGLLEQGELARVRMGDVFVVSRLSREGPRLTSRRVPWALLEVVGPVQAGKCRVRLWHRFQEDDLRPEPGVLGYRAVRLSTVKAVPRLLLLDEKTQKPIDGVRVQFTGAGIAKSVDVVSDRAGLAVAPAPVAGFTLVRLFQGERVIAQLPLAVLDDRPTTCRVPLQEDDQGWSAFELRRGLFMRRLLDNLQLSGDRFQELQQKLGTSLPEALKQAKHGLAQLDEELAHLAGEAEQLQALARKLKAPEPADYPRRLDELRANRLELQRFVDRVETIVKEGAQGGLALTQMLERARLLEVQGEFDQALSLYDKVLVLRPDQKSLKAHADALKAGWQIRSDKHAEARRFLTDIWPRMDTGEIKDQLPKASEALAACKEAGDRLVAVKLRKANTAHAARLKNRLDQLLKKDTEDNRNQIQAIRAAAEALAQFHRDVNALAGTKAD